jgi:4-amino-4-deoxy-L-arabinose transferase-like glycosyltransferase
VAKTRSRLVALLLIALVVRAAWALAQPTDDASLDKLPDQREYLLLAQNLLNGNGLKFYDPRFRDEVYAFRTPGYPLLIAACGANLRAVRFVQAGLDTSTALAIYLLARRWLTEGPALFAAALVAFNPFLIYFTGLLLTETLFTGILAWGMLLLLGTREPTPDDKTVTWRRTAGWLTGGLLLALSVLVRQSGIGLPVALGLAAAFVNRRQGSPYHRRWPLPVGSTMLLLTVAVLLPWAYRNHRVLGAWVWTATNGGITAYDGLNPDATGASDQTFVQSMPELRAMDELGRSKALSDRAKEFVRQQPLRAAELALIKAARTWSPVPLSQDYGGWKYRIVGLLYSLPLDVLVVIGLLRRSVGAGGLTRSAKAFLLLPAIYFTAVHMLTVGSLRYRIPAEPPMAVLAASSAVLPGVGGWKRASRGFEVAGQSSE